MADRPFCSVSGCLEPASGVVLLPYAEPRRIALCEDHIRPIRTAVLEQLAANRRQHNAVEPVRSATL